MHRCAWPVCDQVVGRAHREGMERGVHPSRSYIDAHHAALAWIREEAGER
jgi:hypothetical protein